MPTILTLFEGLKCLSINGFSDKQETEKTMEGRDFLYAYARSPDASVSELLSMNLGIRLNHLGAHIGRECLLISISSCFQD